MEDIYKEYIEPNLLLSIGAATAFIVLLVLLFVAIRRGRKDSPEDFEVGAEESAAYNHRGKWGSAAITLCLVLSLGGNGVLAYFVRDLRQDLDSKGKDLEVKVEESEIRLQAITQAALDQVPDVALVRSDLESLEQTLFGVSGTGAGLDVIGDLQRDVRAADSEINNLKFCVNGAFLRLRNYSNDVATYVGRVVTGGFAVRPTLFTPQCY